MMFRAVFWVVLPCKVIVDNHFTRQYNPEDSSEQCLIGFPTVYLCSSDRMIMNEKVCGGIRTCFKVLAKYVAN
jgi:hypothetical protein